ncbi:hypothetical protein LPW11_10025 [Geomonas sp. RF6]|uniref:hypothetical protein n=1 Tax=Geomonas sp. RF6 TaxID=2897342 RepID=UPI001E35B553|nr:hypothetical protein [Geomonas sp. RF6]UFS72511.1 hypothetical protein LPW11_10025 [Geomonas sp. RF6]
MQGPVQQLREPRRYTVCEQDEVEEGTLLIFGGGIPASSPASAAMRPRRRTSYLAIAVTAFTLSALCLWHLCTSG